MEFSIYLNIGLIIIIVCIIVVYNKIFILNKAKINVGETLYNQLIENYQEMQDQNEVLKNNIINVELSNKNLKNALIYKSLEDGKRHISIGSIDNGEQEVAIVFDEKWTYTNDYFNQQPLCDKEPYIKTKKLNCIAFLDGKTFDPILLSAIDKDSKSVAISSIDCGKYKGRGLGTCVIQSLTETLKELEIEELKASLSPVDYNSKTQLYNFYIRMNGFVLISELTEDSWGKVVKKINNQSSE